MLIEVQEQKTRNQMFIPWGQLKSITIEHYGQGDSYRVVARFLSEYNTFTIGPAGLTRAQAQHVMVDIERKSRLGFGVYYHNMARYTAEKTVEDDYGYDR